MRRLIYLLILPISIYANCSWIQNLDLKNLCKAEVSQKSTTCNYILDRDKKNYCLGIVQKSKSHCNWIKDKDLKNYCLAKIK